MNLSGQWDRPFLGALGEPYKLTLRADTAAYNAFDLNQQPNYQTVNNATTARAQPTAAHGAPCRPGQVEHRIELERVEALDALDDCHRPTPVIASKS